MLERVIIVLEIKLFLLICVANGAPVMAALLFGAAGGCPMDMDRRFIDGRPWFGASKTVRGLVASLVATVLVGVVLVLPLAISIQVAIFAMLGDLSSSFIKRRLAKPAGASVPGLDQIPESLLPLLALKDSLALSIPAVILICTAFTVLALGLAKPTRKLKKLSGR